MSTRASGPFDVTLTPQPADAPGGEAVLGRLLLDKKFHGDLEATSRGQMLAFSTAVKGSAGYVAIERVTGSLHGRNGSFHLQHSGTMNRGAASLVLTVIPDSGTGELAGLSGSMTIDTTGGHSYEMEYTIEAGPAAADVLGMG